MLAKFRLNQFLAISLLGCLVAVTTNSYGQLFEFSDDFTKPASQQRDPWEERIETERHDFTQSAVTVGRGVVQVEGGYSYFYKDTEEVTESSNTGPEMLVRIGLSEDIEFRLRWDYVWQFIDEEADRIGSEDLRFGLKLQMTRQRRGGVLPTSALELRGSAPTGSKVFTTERVEFNLDYIYQWTLTEGVTFAASTGLGTNGFGDFALIPDDPSGEHFLTMSQSAALGLELTESNTMYAEWFGLFSKGLPDELVISVFNVGVDHYVTNDFVVDVRAGIGLTDDSDDFFFGVGGGYRF